MLRNLSGRKWLACYALLAILNAYTLTSLASPGAVLPKGDISVSGQVTLDGHDAVSGATVFSSSNVTTAQDSGAVINLADLGNIRLLQNTNFNLAYTASGYAGSLDSGYAEFASVKGASAEVSAGGLMVTADAGDAASFSVKTENGVTNVAAVYGKLIVKDGDRQLEVAAGQQYSTGMVSAAAGGQDPQQKDDDHKNRKLAFLLLGIGSVVAAVVLVTTNSDSNGGALGGDNGGGINPSPSR
jgi:ferric-dicitrate binding protein FerR (iron transport regulator)